MTDEEADSNLPDVVDELREDEKHELKELRESNLQPVRRRRHNSSLYQYDSTEITKAVLTLPNSEDDKCDDESHDELMDSGTEKAAEREHAKVEVEMLTENVFSLIYTAPVCSAAFWMGIFVSLFQIAMPSLALLDLIVFSDTQNPLQVPSSVSVQVRIIGVMALILAVSQYWDFMEAIFKLERGPPPHSLHLPSGAACW